MLYNQDALKPHYKTAGKITVLTAVVGVALFLFAFVVDFGTTEIQKVSAQTATTTLTVLNTPPEFTVPAYEVIESSTTTPTNSGSIIQWTAQATDANASDYYLLVCSTNATPTAATVGPPSCSSTSTIQWGVSAATPSGDFAVVSTTTTENFGPTSFNEQNDWYAWVCDNDPNNPECNVTPVQGLSATNSSPFFVNRRPVFSGISISNGGAADPGGTLTYTATATDPDLVPAEDNIFLAVCSEQTFSTSTLDCGVDTLATTTIGVVENPAATFALPAIIQDDQYAAFVYLFDQHSHTAIGSLQGSSSDFIVNNVSPEVLGGDITLNNGQNIELTVAGGQTTGFRLDVTVTDANSCLTTASTSEMRSVVASVFRTSIGTTTCNGSAAAYDPNNCYGSLAPTSTWNLVCTASSTSCTHTDIAPDDSQIFNCTFPLWFVAEPTDNGTNTPAILEADTWSAAVAGVDDDNATGTLTLGTNPRELISFVAFDLLTAQIAYGDLAPGQNTGTLRASTTIRNLGNTGLDQEVRGDAMCDGYSPGNPCVTSATSTIPENQQQFASSSLAYNSPAATILSSTTANLVDINAPKTASTTNPVRGNTFFGIAVPASISFSGAYTGMNTFFAVPAPAAVWGI